MSLGVDPTSKSQTGLWVTCDPDPKPKAKRENQLSQVVSLATQGRAQPFPQQEESMH